MSERGEAATSEAANVRLSRQWQAGDRVELEAFLAGLDLGPTELVAVLLVDQRERWRLGERVPAESYLRRFPGLEGDREAVVELAYGEVLLRESCGERPPLEEYLWRFPEHQDRLRQQVEFHRLLEASSADSEGGATSTSSDSAQAPHESGGLPVIPGYEVLSVLGRGGMGVVYKARQQGLNRLVALKMILNADHSTEQERERFRREGQAIARLAHPNIIQIYDIGDHQGKLFLALELLHGGDLDDKLSGTPLPAREAAQLVEEVARAMQVAHDAGVVHRDLKPANILLTETGLPKITDFGLAKKLDDVGQTESGAIVGTPSYAAPEQAQGKTKEIGPATDVYALGAILYECLTGRPPFRAARVMDTILQVIAEQPVSPSQLQPRTPRDLETICLKCLEKDPVKRYRSAADLAADLHRYQRGEPIQARAVGRLEKGWRWCKRNPVVAGLLTAVFLTLSLGVIASLTFATRAIRQAERADDEQKDRAVAQVDALLNANLPSVETILDTLRPYRGELLPRLREARNQPRPLDPTPASVRVWQQQRLRAALALVEDDPEQLPFLQERMLAEDVQPEEFLIIRDLLARPYGQRLSANLWELSATAEARSPLRFRCLVALARFDPQSPRWQANAGDVVDMLLEANALQVGVWSSGLHDIKDRLLAPLQVKYRAAEKEQHRHLAASVLHDYAADQPALLAELLLEADPRQFVSLFAGVKPYRDQALPLFEKELSLSPISWNDRPLDPAWPALPQATVAEVEKAQGMVAERFALCQTLPLERFPVVADVLRRSGYRPTRCRPVAPLSQDREGPCQVVVLWSRDGGDWQMACDQTAQQLQASDEHWHQAGYVPVDLAGYVVAAEGGRHTRFIALWSRPRFEGDRAVIAADIPAEDHKKALDAFGKDGLEPATIQAFVGPVGTMRYCGIWRKTDKSANDWTVALDCSETRFREVLDDLMRPPVDVSLLASAGEPLPSGPSTETTALRYSVVSHALPSLSMAQSLGLDVARHLERCRELAAKGYRPAALSAAEALGTDRKGPRYLTASVWQRPSPSDAVREQLGRRQANAAAALLLLEGSEKGWEVLRHSPYPNARSHLIHLLGPLQVEARQVIERLKSETDISRVRALVLALGEYEEYQLPTPAREEVKPVLLKWYRDDPDAGLHSAIDWLLRPDRDGPAPRKIAWHSAAALQGIDGELQGKPVAGRRWYVNSQTQTLAILDAREELLMGSPGHEQWRAPEEVLHRRRIGRTFAMGVKEVTMAQYENFLKAHPKARYTISRQWNPDPDEPCMGVTWYEAVMYCRWLSEQDNIPETQMCYPSCSEILKCAVGGGPVKLPPDYLTRTGYRLPTEAEWEFACRAGSLGSRSYGSSDALLTQYAWYLLNSENRAWPVGQKKPNDFGLFDLYGNVGEWIQETVSPYRIGSGGQPSPDNEDRNDITGSTQLQVRGASFYHIPRNVRSAARFDLRPNYRDDVLGIRVARTIR